MKKQLDNNTEIFNATEYLQKLHTKQLLKLRDTIYQITPQKGLGVNFLSENENQLQYIDSEPKYDVSNTFKNYYVTLNQVRMELKTREHIPNKAEAKEIRQQRAKNRVK